jgi:hypothetical protein
VPRLEYRLRMADIAAHQAQEDITHEKNEVDLC